LVCPNSQFKLTQHRNSTVRDFFLEGNAAPIYQIVRVWLGPAGYTKLKPMSHMLQAGMNLNILETRDNFAKHSGGRRGIEREFDFLLCGQIEFAD